MFSGQFFSQTYTLLVSTQQHSSNEVRIFNEERVVYGIFMLLLYTPRCLKRMRHIGPWHFNSSLDDDAGSQRATLNLGQVPVRHDEPKVGFADAAQQVRVARRDLGPFGFP